jgi:hypothetical protein
MAEIGVRSILRKSDPLSNPDHLAILEEALAKEDISIWSDWRAKHAETVPALSEANVSGARKVG